MFSRRARLRLLIVLLAIALIFGVCYAIGRYLLKSNGVERLDWSGLSVTTDGVHLAQLQLEQRSAAGSLELSSENLQLGWRDFGLHLPFWQHLDIDRLAVAWQPEERGDETPSPASIDLQQLVAPIALLPRSIVIRDLHATLPCARGQCSAHGSLNVQRQPDNQLTLQLNLEHQQQVIGTTVDLQPLSGGFALQLQVAVDQQLQIGLSSQMREQGDGLLWSGKLDASQLSQAATLQSWLSNWALPDGIQWPDAPGEAGLQGEWQLALANRDLQPQTLLGATGSFDVQGELPQPWPIPGLGLLQGSLALAAHNAGDQWQAAKLEANLQLTQPTGDWLQKLPAELRSESLQLQVQPDTALADLREPLAQRSLPLKLELKLRGATRLDLQGRLALATAAPWAVQFAETRISSQTTSVRQAGWQANALKADLRLAGYVDAGGITLGFGTGSQVQVASLQGADLKLQQVQASLADGTFEATLHDAGLHAWQFKGSPTLSSTRLEQANLKPQGWRWAGQVTASDQATRARGKLSNDSELQLDLDAHLDTKQNLQLKATLGELFLRSGNPLAKTLAQWPEVLDLNSGRLNATANMTLPAASSTPNVELNFTGKGVGGIYDRAELSGLDARVQVKLARQHLDLDIQELHLQQANPGLPIGPLDVRGRYSAPLASVTQGQLQLSLAQTALMGGRVILTPGQWDLAAANPLFPIQIRGLELQQLFTLYPAEGLAGSGTLDGDLPLRLGQNGIEVQQGQIAARKPGGRLQFSSEKIKALGRSNPAMQLVTQSLEDFNFTTLSSSVDYDQHGKLNLGMRLEGQNPAIENGRPIHFNINLEEDIPNLLASLQLTDRVNEIITRRVQQRLLQRNAAPKEP